LTEVRRGGDPIRAASVDVGEVQRTGGEVVPTRWRGDAQRLGEGRAKTFMED
jgi:hypothetical protein